MSVLAGAARHEITPPGSVELMGYGARVGVSTGVHDPLFARGLYLGDGAARGVLLVSADVCLITPDQARGVREALARETQLSPASILISCTHTHSGPDTGLGPLMTGRPVPSWVDGLFAGVQAAGSEAFQARQPARFGWTTAQARIGRNRRIEDGPVDPEILILEVHTASGRPLAVLFNYACHGTVLGHDNLEVSADWAGVAASELEAQTGGVAQFVLGAHADIDPRTRGLMDLGIDGQSVGLGFDAVRALGLEVAESVLEALGRPQRLDAEAPLGGASRSVRATCHLGDLEPEAAREALERRRTQLARRLGSDVAAPRTRQLFSLAAERAATLPISEARELLAQVRLFVRDQTAARWLDGERGADIEVQTLRIGDAALLALPLEPTTAVGLDWKRRARASAALAGVAGIGNGWLRYLPHADDLAHPRAHWHYEVLSSLFRPETCERLLATGEQLLASEVLS